MKTPLVYSITTKFVLIAAVIMGLFSYSLGRWFLLMEETQLANYLENDGKQLLMSLKIPIINTLLYEELGSGEIGGFLSNLVDEIVSSHDYNTVYVFITDTNGKILAHNRLTQYGRVVDDPLTRAALKGAEYQSRIIGDKRRSDAILDMAMPLSIFGKNWGVLRAGFSLAPMHKQLAETRKTIWWFSSLFFLLGTALFSLVGITMSRPLIGLAHAMGNVTPETFDVDIAGQRRDEIGLLQGSFRAMLERLKQSEANRQRAVASMIQHEKLASIGTLVAGVAHEVNNPLVAIATCIHNLERRTSAVEADDVDILKQGFSRIQTIVRQLTDFSRAGSLVLKPVSSELFFKEMVSFARMSSRMRVVKLKVTDQCLPPLKLMIDKSKLHQVVLDLLINAVDASPSQGTVELQAYLDRGDYCISVTDEGEGIPPEARVKIFEIFYTTKPAGKGTGIGLAVCKTIVDMHHGELLLESSPGETTFTVKVPLDTERSSGHV